MYIASTPRPELQEREAARKRADATVWAMTAAGGGAGFYLSRKGKTGQRVGSTMAGMAITYLAGFFLVWAK
jgi:hypothetical protein